jgi:hypothetical protein
VNIAENDGLRKRVAFSGRSEVGPPSGVMSTVQRSRASEDLHSGKINVHDRSRAYALIVQLED